MRRFVIYGMTAALLLFPALALAQQQGQQQRSLNTEFAMSWVTGVLSVVYFPVKFSVALVGAPIGGVAGFLTGGNERAAEGIWRPTVGGAYFITPEVFAGTEPFSPVDRGVPQSQGRRTGGMPTSP